ncbi:hypothetical protein FB45DRAFT_914871, partial [Roridomyces roridus]
MARSWPRIETIELESYHGTSQPRTTLRYLESFPRHCHYLSKLCISFDATAVPTTLQDLSLDSLEELDVEASPITTAEPVAEFLAGLFPNLGSITPLAGELDENDPRVSRAFAYSQIWREVDSLL